MKAHSFRSDLDAKHLSFYIVQDFDTKKRERERNELLAEIKKEFPDMTVEIYTSMNVNKSNFLSTLEHFYFQ